MVEIFVKPTLFITFSSLNGKHAGLPREKVMKCVDSTDISFITKVKKKRNMKGCDVIDLSKAWI
jgi:hypothetical protein